MKTSISLPSDLVQKIKRFNEAHRDRPINVSGVCQNALETVLNGVIMESANKKRSKTSACPSHPLRIKNAEHALLMSA